MLERTSSEERGYSMIRQVNKDTPEDRPSDCESAVPTFLPKWQLHSTLTFHLDPWAAFLLNYERYDVMNERE